MSSPVPVAGGGPRVIAIVEDPVVDRGRPPRRLTQAHPLPRTSDSVPLGEILPRIFCPPFVGPAKPTPEELAQGPTRRLLYAKLKELGWVEGQNLKFDDVWTGGRVELTSPLMEELVRKQVDVILVVNTGAAVAAVRATKTIPIVMVGSSAYRSKPA
jgi:hypothetical protein